jgi:multicomponent Na+:H+ antiporter subunit E
LLAFLKRTLLYLASWIVMIGGVDSVDVAVGAFVALVAAGMSVWLRPPGDHALRLVPLAGFTTRFLRDSLVAGVDVARRAFAPSMPLRTGFVSYAPELPPGDARVLFTGISSLMPGSVPVGGDGSGGVLFHCLDTDQPIAAQLAKQEARLVATLGRGPRGHAA